MAHHLKKEHDVTVGRYYVLLQTESSYVGTYIVRSWYCLSVPRSYSQILIWEEDVELKSPDVIAPVHSEICKLKSFEFPSLPILDPLSCRPVCLIPVPLVS